MRMLLTVAAMIAVAGAWPVAAQQPEAVPQTAAPSTVVPAAPAPGNPVDPAPGTPAVETPLVPPASVGTPSATGGAELEASLPEVKYGDDGLPDAVKALRARILEATRAGDPEGLRPIIAAQPEPPSLPGGEGGDPIAQLKLLSGDEGGQEILAILEETIEAGYLHIDVGTPQEMYVWPYFYRYPLDKLTPKQLVELFRIIGAGDLADMKDKGVYSFYRVGISPDGQWRFFEDGD